MGWARILQMLLGTALVMASAAAQLQEFPSRAITIMVPAPAGGSADSLARALGSKLSSMTGHPMVIENKPGGAGVIGARAVITAEPDGHTLMLQSTPSIIVGPNTTEPRPFNPIKDLIPITTVGRAPAVLVIHPKFGIKTLNEFVDYAKANPGKINMASSGIGTGGHFNIEFLQREAGVKVTHVPYRGSPQAMADLLGGHVDGMFSDASFFLTQIKARTVIALATAAPQRISWLSDVPTTGEQGYPNLLGENLYWMFVAAGTSPEVIRNLNTLITTGLRDPEVIEAYNKQSVIIAMESPQQAASHYAGEEKRWTPLVRELMPSTQQN